MKKLLLFAIIFTTFVIAIGEVGARFAGLIDFPLYDANPRIGYIPKPNQEGSFLNQNDWVFNELSMGVGRAFAPSENQDVLVIGDSIVLGGNPYRQRDKLGPQIETASGSKVWPISAGSWALQNEVQWLSDNPDVVRAVDRIVIISNSADFQEPSSWSSEVTHPRSKPAFALLYLAKKVLFPNPGTPSPQLTVPRRDAISYLVSFASTTNKPIDIWLYPTKDELVTKQIMDRDFAPSIRLLENAGISGATFHKVQDIAGWSADIYKDSIHPTPKGFEILAKAIAKTLADQPRP